MKLTGAQILIKMIKAEGIDTIFGYPGGAVIDIYDALAKQDGLHHILVRHEQGAVHAADGYASVVFTGQVPTTLIGNDAFQEVDIVGITRPCTKHNYLVKDVTKLASIIKEAFHLARSGRPGPVLVDLPKDIQNARIDFKEPEEISLKSYKPNYKPNKKQLKKVVDLIGKAKRPVIFTGGGVILSQASADLTRLAKMADIPVTASLMGLGAFPGSDPLWLGMLGMHGQYEYWPL